MNKSLNEIVNAVLAQINREIISDRSHSPEDCIEALDELEGYCAEYSQQIKHENKL